MPNKITMVKIIREKTGAPLNIAVQTADALREAGFTFDDQPQVAVRKVTTLDLENYYLARYAEGVIREKASRLQRAADKAYDAATEASDKTHEASQKILGY